MATLTVTSITAGDGTVIVNTSDMTGYHLYTATDLTTVSFTVNATGTDPITYQWQKLQVIDGTPSYINIDGATSSTYTITNLDKTYENGYRVVIVNPSTPENGVLYSFYLLVTYTPPTVSVLTPVRVLNGTAATFSPDISGSFITGYQWQKNNDDVYNDIVGATNSTYTTSATTGTDDETKYRIKVFHEGGVVESSDITLEVNTLPVITSSGFPNNGIFHDVKTATLTATATGTGPLLYIWERMKDIMDGSYDVAQQSASNLYTINILGAGPLGIFRLTVKNKYGSQDVGDMRSLSASFTQTNIATQPQNINVDPDQNATFSVYATGFELTYQWQKKVNGSFQDIQGATSDSYTLPAVSDNDIGTYRVRVFSIGGNVNSSEVSLNIYKAPTISFITASKDVLVEGQTVDISASAIAGYPTSLSYQWQKKTGSTYVNITGATSTTYTIPVSDLVGDTVIYRVAVSNGRVTPTSTDIVLSLKYKPTIQSLTPSGQQYIPIGTSTTLSVDASGTGQLRYMWYYNSVIIPGANASSYILPNPTASNNGTYYVVITNDYGSIQSDNIILTFGVVPTISSPSPSMSTGLDAGESITLSATLSGSTPYTYSWKRRPVTTTTETDISSGTTSSTDISYSIASFNTTTDPAYYILYITNSFGTTNYQFQLTAGAKPKISTQSQNKTINEGDLLSLSVISSNTTSYIWQFSSTSPTSGFTPITGATASTYTVNSTTYNANNGYYRVVLTNQHGSTVSQVISVTININVRNAIATGAITNLVLNTEYTRTESGILYGAIKKDVSNGTAVYPLTTSTISTLSLSNIPTKYQRVAIYITSPFVNATTGVYNINVGVVLITVSSSNGTETPEPSGTISSPITCKVKPSGSDIQAASLNVYRKDGNNRIFVGVASRQSDGFYSIGLDHFSEYEFVQESVPCFVEGTRVLSGRGFVAVENLVNGDRIITDDGRAVPFALARRVVERATTDNAPYLVSAGAFGPDMPPAPCRLSPTHAFQIAAGLWHFPELAARSNSAIQQYGIGKPCTYYHIKLPNYFTDNIVLEGGTVAESFGEDLKDLGTFFYFSEKHGGFIRVDPRSKKVRSPAAHV
jgi:hypothetical protein